jgi:prepilin peptidase CpaA
MAPLLQPVLLALVVTAAVYDYRSRRIPNWLTLTGAMAGLLLNTVLFGLPGLGGAAKALVYGFAVYFALYLLHAMGAGDVKLMAGVSAFAGPGRWFTIFILTSLIGGITGLLLVIARGRLRHTFWNIGFVFFELMRFRLPHLAKEELDVRNPKAVTLPAGVRVAAGVIAYIVISAIWGR